MIKSDGSELPVTKLILPIVDADVVPVVVTAVAMVVPVALGVTSTLPAYITKVLLSKPTVPPVAGLV
jgi:hypothetical protein